MSDHPFEELGFVTAGAIEVDGMYWGIIDEWKEKYDTAIENLLAATESANALAVI